MLFQRKLCLIEFSNRKKFGVKFLKNVNMNFRFLLAWMGMLISNFILLLQSDMDSN